MLSVMYASCLFKLFIPMVNDGFIWQFFVKHSPVLTLYKSQFQTLQATKCTALSLQSHYSLCYSVQPFGKKKLLLVLHTKKLCCKLKLQHDFTDRQTDTHIQQWHPLAENIATSGDRVHYIGCVITQLKQKSCNILWSFMDCCARG